MLKLKAILFDVDGVLLDSSRANAAFFRELIKRGGGEFHAEDMPSHFHLSMADMLHKFFPEKNHDQIRELMKIGDSLDVGYDLLKMYDGVAEIIPVFAQQYKLGLVTNRTLGGIQELWDISGLKEHFSSWSAYEYTENHKPDPEPVQYVLNQLGVTPAEAVFIGDAATDLQAGQAAGVPVIIIASEPMAGAAATIQSFGQIPSAIEKLSS